MNRKRNNEIPAELASRVTIEAVRPEIDEGRYPIKRTPGEVVKVSADVFADGHDLIRTELRYRRQGSRRWSHTAMKHDGNDGWHADFDVEEEGRYEYTVSAWIDPFGSWQQDLEKKVNAGQDVESELLEGGQFLRAATERAGVRDRERLKELAKLVAAPGDLSSRVSAALGARATTLMARHGERRGAVDYSRILHVLVERERARYGAWYEMFPRSAGSDPSRSATFREVEERLDYVAGMGFDVLYLPPIHPIGKSHRKGPNNTLDPSPGDPGSPWAIGCDAGGHKSVDPDLGTLADFEHLVTAAREKEIEIALDIAFQCSPDHPYVREHPEWFKHRPDGSIKYAENPPKKYQDIYPLDFECEAWQSLWQELLDVVLFWVGHGVQIFRVDNPHTKSFGFWDWLIGEVWAEHPEVVFLSEAFTRPKRMKSLAKRGFSQSYTYFTWRNTKQELTEYFTELTETEASEYLRPNLFTNTPDILHEYLQFGGRAAFQARLVLAATLGATYGIYGPPFELCEGRALPGMEEYQDSEKYQIRVWDLDRPGNIRDYVTRVNQIRRDNPALHSDRSLSFHNVDNDSLIVYSKKTPDLSNVVLTAVNLDPHHTQSGWLELPLDELGVSDEHDYQVHDLLGEARYLWHGARNFVSLDPSQSPAHIFRVRRRVKSERDFDYFL